MNEFLNRVVHGDCVEVMKYMPSESVDLTVTSPPYDNLRTYNGYTFDFEAVADELYRVTKPGGVVVWVVGDKTEKGSESGTSFRQALHFKEIGFNLHDTMIYTKSKVVPMDFKCHRYYQGFEYMFVLSKGKPKTCNYIRIPTKHGGKKAVSINRKEDGELREDRVKKQQGRVVADTKIKSNVWEYASESVKGHPAPFPEGLALDHIATWSDEGDTILDPMCGSGTTLKAARMMGRNYVGIDCSSDYVELSRKRIESAMSK